MVGWLRFHCLALIVVGLALASVGPATTPARAAGKTVPKIAFVFYDKKTRTHILSIADPDGKNVVNLFKDGYFFSPAWSPDGTQLAFIGSVSGSAWELYLIGSDGSNLRKISSHTGLTNAGSVAWSPDGTQLIYSAYNAGYTYFYRINADGSGDKKLSFKDIIIGSSWVAWSADGKQVAVHSSLSNYFQIVLADPDGENVKPLPVRSAVKGGVTPLLVWSPDKHHIFIYEWPAYTYGAPSELYVADLDGSNAKVILKSPKLSNGILSIAISPDGKQLLFVAGAPGEQKQTALWIANADGSRVYALPLRGLHPGTGTSWGMVPQDALPKGGPISFAEVAK